MTPVATSPAPLRAPVRVVDVDLARPGEFRTPGDREPVVPEGPVRALVRLHGAPLGMVSAMDGSAAEDLWGAVTGAARRELGDRITQHRTADRGGARDGGGWPCQAARRRALREAPGVSVIVATHNRAEQLRGCLSSLLRSEYPEFEIIVVDNAPADDAAEALVRDTFRGRVRYVREPVAGLARAHNRGLEEARAPVVAFTDDDTLVDPHWLAALAETFARDARVGCVTGLIVPAELETPAQTMLERHGGFTKGYAPCAWSLSAPPADPLFPFTAGRFGSGANMAFRTDTLRSLGGFDPATGTGTPARGGDDLLAFFEVLAAGHILAYQPGAIVWHRHRRTQDAVAAQAFGYGAGLGAYLTGTLVHHPRMLPALLRRLPRGIRHLATRSRDRGSDPDAGWSTGLALLEARGVAYGPYGYLRGRLDGDRTASRPALPPGAAARRRHRRAPR